MDSAIPPPPPPAAKEATGPTATTAAPVFSILGGRVHVAAEIGRGSFATVHRATDHAAAPPRPVAVKRIPLAKLSRKLLANLSSEISILHAVSQHRHRNVVNLVAWERRDADAEPAVYLVLDWCAGGDLSQWLRAVTTRSGAGVADLPALHAAAVRALSSANSSSPTTTSRIPVGGPWGGVHYVVGMHLLGQLANALAFLRSHSLMHRDLKPQNLLLHPLTLPRNFTSVGASPPLFDPASHLAATSRFLPLTAASALSFPALITSVRQVSRGELDPAAALPDPTTITADDSVAAATVALMHLALLPHLPTLKLADFGFARYLPTPTSLAETLCGSPLYMAPEILRYEKYDTRADLWSVGCIAYEVWFGRVPYRAVNHIELLRKIERGKDRVRFPRGSIPESEPTVNGSSLSTAPAPIPARTGPANPADLVARSAPSAFRTAGPMAAGSAFAPPSFAATRAAGAVAAAAVALGSGSISSPSSPPLLTNVVGNRGYGASAAAVSSAPVMPVTQPAGADTDQPAVVPNQLLVDERNLLLHLLKQRPHDRLSVDEFFEHPAIMDARALANAVADWQDFGDVHFRSLARPHQQQQAPNIGTPTMSAMATSSPFSHLPTPKSGGGGTRPASLLTSAMPSPTRPSAPTTPTALAHASSNAAGGGSGPTSPYGTAGAGGAGSTTPRNRGFADTAAAAATPVPSHITTATSTGPQPGRPSVGPIKAVPMPADYSFSPSPPDGWRGIRPASSVPVHANWRGPATDPPWRAPATTQANSPGTARLPTVHTGFAIPSPGQQQPVSQSLQGTDAPTSPQMPFPSLAAGGGSPVDTATPLPGGNNTSGSNVGESSQLRRTPSVGQLLLHRKTMQAASGHSPTQTPVSLAVAGGSSTPAVAASSSTFERDYIFVDGVSEEEDESDSGYRATSAGTGYGGGGARASPSGGYGGGGYGGGRETPHDPWPSADNGTPLRRRTGSGASSLASQDGSQSSVRGGQGRPEGPPRRSSWISGIVGKLTAAIIPIGPSTLGSATSVGSDSSSRPATPKPVGGGGGGRGSPGGGSPKAGTTRMDMDQSLVHIGQAGATSDGPSGLGGGPARSTGPLAAAISWRTIPSFVPPTVAGATTEPMDPHLLGTLMQLQSLAQQAWAVSTLAEPRISEIARYLRTPPPAEIPAYARAYACEILGISDVALRILDAAVDVVDDVATRADHPAAIAAAAAATAGGNGGSGAAAAAKGGARALALVTHYIRRLHNHLLDQMRVLGDVAAVGAHATAAVGPEPAAPAHVVFGDAVVVVDQMLAAARARPGAAAPVVPAAAIAGDDASVHAATTFARRAQLLFDGLLVAAHYRSVAHRLHHLAASSTTAAAIAATNDIHAAHAAAAAAASGGDGGAVSDDDVHAPVAGMGLTEADVVAITVYSAQLSNYLAAAREADHQRAVTVSL